MPITPRSLGRSPLMWNSSPVNAEGDLITFTEEAYTPTRKQPSRRGSVIRDRRRPTSGSSTVANLLTGSPLIFGTSPENFGRMSAGMAPSSARSLTYSDVFNRGYDLLDRSDGFEHEEGDGTQLSSPGGRSRPPTPRRCSREQGSSRDPDDDSVCRSSRKLWANLRGLVTPGTATPPPGLAGGTKMNDGEYLETSDGEYRETSDGEYRETSDGEYRETSDGESLETNDVDWERSDTESMADFLYNQGDDYRGLD